MDWSCACLMIFDVRAFFALACCSMLSQGQLHVHYLVNSLHIFIFSVKFFALTCSLKMANMIHARTTYNTHWRNRHSTINVFIHISPVITHDYYKTLKSQPPGLVRHRRHCFKQLFDFENNTTLAWYILCDIYVCWAYIMWVYYRSQIFD